ncbi:hypothetical protein H6F89_21700 [Cyanobacteria bacterium FACHB-63]|nr:hypothetical protein [Cyanobacteria bacterium FACHB-63]
MPVCKSSIWQSFSTQELDRLCWKAICEWTAYSDVQVIRNRLDFSELTRFFLWDKVARAIRQQANPEQFQFEAEWLSNRAIVLPQNQHSSLKSRFARSLRSIQSSIQARRDVAQLKSQALRQQTPILYIPSPHPQLNRTIEALRQSSWITLAAPKGAFSNSVGIHEVTPPAGEQSIDSQFVENLHNGILKGLSAQNIELLEIDAAVLKTQIATQLRHLQQVETELDRISPSAILVFHDNHYPIQDYVLAAKARSIPSIMLQHGLDCEHYCIDEAYASAIALWGVARKHRYLKDSRQQPELMEVTGHPEYDSLQLPQQLDLTGSYWLWTTRPHSPEKCYSPSRLPQEGLDILAALLDALQAFPAARLVIKPHPSDYGDRYRSMVVERNFSDRVEISTAPIQSLLPQASLVISEDSTTGMEAMFFGKVLIHAHFADSHPVLPFVEYAAAFPANSATMLRNALFQADQISPSEQARQFQGQRRFIQDFAGECDGRSTQRVVDLIRRVSCSNSEQLK